MKSINNILKNEFNCEHTLRLLQLIITSIESYPELSKTKKIEELDKQSLPLNKYNQQIELINQDYQEEQQKIATSNLKNIKKILSEIEILLKDINNKTDENNIKSRINYLNDQNLTNIYLKEKKLKEKRIEKLKRKLTSELQLVNKDLCFYATLLENNGTYIIDENIKKKTSLGDLLQDITIDELIEDIKLEDYLEEYYQQLGSNLIDLNFKKLYLNKQNNNLEKLRISKYPTLKLVAKIIPLSPTKGQILEKKCKEVADLLITIDQLNNLKEYLFKNKYELTIEYIDKKINILQQQINNYNSTITKIWNDTISTININNMIKDKDKKNKLLELLKEILIITESEAKNNLSYDYGDIEYREIIKEDLIRNQEILLKYKYNINMSLTEIKQILSYHQEQKNSSQSLKKHPNPINKLLKRTKKRRRR